jgi:hypothetical protein
LLYLTWQHGFGVLFAIPGHVALLRYLWTFKYQAWSEAVKTLPLPLISVVLSRSSALTVLASLGIVGAGLEIYLQQVAKKRAQRSL